MVHPEYRPQKPQKQFTGRLYGFKIHPSAYDLQGPGTKAVRMAQVNIIEILKSKYLINDIFKGHTISRKMN